MKRLFIITAALAVLTSAAAVERPRLVVGIVVDQMRWDYLYNYQWGEGGFKRLMDEGYSFEQTLINYVPTTTACGHASIFTGTTPAVHGIAGNNYWVDGDFRASVADTALGVSPRNLLTTTIGDQLKLGTDMKGRVIGVALKDRAAILPAGHAADGAYWYSGRNHKFVSSSYYGSKVPEWVERFNRDNASTLSKELTMVPEGVTMTFALAEAAIENEQLGADDVTDMLTVSISTTDAAAHVLGTYVPRIDSIYHQLDSDLAHFFSTLDRRVGRGNYLLFLTADHGGTHNMAYMTPRHLPTGTWDSNEAQINANKKLEAQFGVGYLIRAHMLFNVYLDNNLIARHHLDRNAVADAAMAALSEDPAVDRVVDFKRLSSTTLPDAMRSRLEMGYYPGRSGDLFVMVKQGYYGGKPSDKGATHGSWSMPDTHIPWLMMGWHVPHGETTAATTIADIAPTVCAMLHIQMPTGCTGHAQPLPHP